MSAMDDFKARALVSIEARGCVCHPALEAVPVADGTLHVAVHHHRWCPLIRSLLEGADGGGSLPGSVASEFLMSDGSTEPWQP